MAKLRRRVIYTDIRWEETEPLTEEQIKKWNQKMKIFKKKLWMK